jgi:hypothetical protein
MEMHYAPRATHAELEARLAEAAERRRVRHVVRKRGDWTPVRRH